MAQFFFSYAHDNWTGGYLKRFLDDLREDIGQFLPGQEASFRDHKNTPLGAEWEPALVDALHTCNAFVAVISPSYIGSEYCGKEWDAFSKRLKRFSRTIPPLILPVLWVPPAKDLPDIVTSLQYSIDQFGDDYAEIGLFRLIKNSSNYEAAYQTFRDGFSQALVDAINTHPLDPDPARPGFDQLENLFDPAAAAPGHSPASQGPNHVRFAVVAGNQKELEKIRKGDIGGYGADAKAWAPFVDEEGRKQSLASRAQLVVAQASLTSDFVNLDDFLGEIDSALQTNHLVAMLVDAWSLQLPKYRDKMEAYDSLQQVNCTVLIPEEGPPSVEEAIKKDLEKAINRAFPNKAVMAPDPVSYRKFVPGDEFEQVLSDILIKLQSRILQYRDVLRPVTGPGPTERPGISGVVP